MKKTLFILLAVMLCMFINAYTVNAVSEKDILKSIVLYTQTSNYQLGDKMTFNVEATEEISSMKITFYNPVSKDGHYYGSFVVDLTGNCSSGNNTKCTFDGYIPEIIDGYYATDENDFIEMTIYPGTYEMSSISVYDKDGNLTRYTTNKEYADSSDFLYYPTKIGVNIKELKKDGPDILKSIALYTQTSNYYIGDKMIFNVETTEEISSMNISFYNPVSKDGHYYGMFTVYLTPDGSYNGSMRSYSGYIPKTIAGYYAADENGRTEMTIYPGTYEMSSIFVYDKSGNIIRYTTNKEYADISEFLYYEPKIEINLKEPTADELNDVNFTLNKLKLKSQTATIGGQVPLDVKYSYNDTNKKIKSIYLIFRDSSKKKTFTTYVKSLFSNPYFIVASSADVATYKLDSIGVTFEALDGTNNTIIINGASNSGKYSEIFNQNLTINKSTGDDNSENERLYFSAHELNDEVYKKIQNSKDDSIIIDADNYTIIPLQLFDIIKNSKKNLIVKHNNNEWIFNGEDIKVSKDIDVLMNFYEINNSNISNNLKKSLNGEGVILEFPDNGDLPGNVLIRIKDTEIISKLTGDKYYIYYADTKNDKLNKVALEVQKTSEGYIEFYINHNSKYVISSTEIKDQTVLGEDDSLLAKNTLLNEETKSLNKEVNPILLYSLIAFACVLIVIIVTTKIIKTHNKTVANKENNNLKENLE